MEKNIFEKLAVKSKFQKLEIFFFFLLKGQNVLKIMKMRLMAN